MWTCRYGFQGFYNPDIKPLVLTPQTVDGIQLQGGTILGTSRGGANIREIVKRLDMWGVNMLFVVGGNGGNAGANAIHEMCMHENVMCAVVGIPKSIDNDILLVRPSPTPVFAPVGTRPFAAALPIQCCSGPVFRGYRPHRTSFHHVASRDAHRLANEDKRGTQAGAEVALFIRPTPSYQHPFSPEYLRLCRPSSLSELSPVPGCCAFHLCPHQVHSAPLRT